MGSERHMKKKSKWKAIRNTILGIIIVIVAVLAFAYNRIQPNQHFKTVPVVDGGNTTQQSNGSFNILLMGSDQRPGQSIGHSDTMMLAHVDLSKDQINAISIPRDTRVHLSGYGYTKLTSVQYVLQSKNGPKQGIEGAVKTISDFTGVPINYYAETNFEGLQAMVDALGGITMNVPETVKIGSQVITAGPHFVNGTSALAIARERHTAAGGDYGRQMAQVAVLKGIAEEALSPGNIPKLPSLVNSVSKYMVATNMSTSDMLSLGLAVKGIDPNKQVNYKQLQGVQESLYDDVLKARNDEIVIDQQQMKSIIAKYFQD
ncbi:LCP family protein [Neobacillus ginsengisoli]|uniref:LCP family protein required for cell wall assembly n=1 Tax=Neobacillus ginsengisoli TaxID=904295 RepID=A0ABT9XUT1_9BACI|nr:LCP family protein [Neobacillus ginsengisoli]MDQ0199326.1 LCP family protein required for cell wall assembly [Neobacillus ginsengisoli]